MKRIIICLLTTTALINTTYSAIDQNLKYGTKNDFVFQLQEYLISKGVLKSSASGFFGLLTLKAVKEYQTSVGLPSTGYVGSLTREKINKDLEVAILPSIEAEVLETGTTTPIAVPPTETTSVSSTTVTPQVFFYQPVDSVPVITKTLSLGCQQVAKTTDGKFVCNFSSFVKENDVNKAVTSKVIITYNDNGNDIAVEDYNGGASLYFSKSGKYTISLSVPSLGLNTQKEIEIKD